MGAVCVLMMDLVVKFDFRYMFVIIRIGVVICVDWGVDAESICLWWLFTGACVIV